MGVFEVFCAVCEVFVDFAENCFLEGGVEDAEWFCGDGGCDGGFIAFEPFLGLFCDVVLDFS